QPPLGVGRPVIADDQIEIEHQPFELLLAQARAVEQHSAAGRAVLVGDRLCHRLDPKIDRQAQLLDDELAKVGHGMSAYAASLTNDSGCAGVRLIGLPRPARNVSPSRMTLELSPSIVTSSTSSK